MIFGKNFRFQAAEQIKNVINFLHKKPFGCLQKGIENGRHLFMLKPLKHVNLILIIYHVLTIRLRIIVLVCSLLDLSQKIRGKK